MKNIIKNLKEKLNRFNRVIKLRAIRLKRELKHLCLVLKTWCIYRKDRTRLLLVSVAFRLKKFFYNFAPSTIRLKALTSVKFLKFRKKFIERPTFLIKRFLFKYTAIIKDFFSDLYFYLKNIFIKHWKLCLFTIIIVMVIALLSGGATVKMWPSVIIDHFLNPSKQERLYDFYLTIAAILGTFLGLYFTATSIIAQTIYAKVNGEIDDLLKSIRLSNIYVKSIIFFLIIVLASIFMQIQDVNIGIWNFYIVCALSFATLISFWELGTYIFYFFNPAKLIRAYILPAIQENIIKATKQSMYKYDPSFQVHLYRQTERKFNVYDSMVEFGTKQELLQINTITDIIDNAFDYLTWYTALKSKIPTESYWFPQKYQHSKYITANTTELDMAQNRGALLNPKTIHDYMWIEERFVNIINQCLKTLFEHKKYQVYYATISKVSIYLRNINAQNKSDEAFFILDRLYNPFIDKSKSLDPFCAFIADAYMSIFVDLTLSCNTNPKASVQSITAKKILKRGFIHSSTRFPLSVKKKLEDIYKRLCFEQKVEKVIKTPDWHIQNLLIDTCNEFNRKFFEDIISRTQKQLETYSEPEFINQNPDIAIAIFNRAYELYEKLLYKLNESVRNCNKDNFYDTTKTKLKIIKSTLLKLIIKLSPYLKPTDGETPDYLGFTYVALHNEITDIMIEKDDENQELIGKLLAVMYIVADAQVKDIMDNIKEISASGKEPVVINNNVQWYSRKLVVLFIELMDLSGYIFLLDDVYGKSLKDKIIPVWNVIIEQKGLEFLLAVIKDYNNPPLMMMDDNLQFNLTRQIAATLSGLGLLWEQNNFFGRAEPEQPDKIYSSNILKNVCNVGSHGLTWTPPKGYAIFVAVYLFDQLNEEQKKEILKSYKIQDVRKMMEIETDGI